MGDGRRLRRTIGAAGLALTLLVALVPPAGPSAAQGAGEPGSGALTADVRRLSSGGRGAGEPVVAAQGSTVHAAWQDHGLRPDGVGAIALRTSHDGGATFGPPRRFDAGMGEARAPQVAASGDRVYLAWSETTAPGGPDVAAGAVLLAVSRDGGRTFDAPVRLDAPGPHDSRVAGVAAWGDGATVLWSDLSGGVFAATTTDAGRAFTAPLTLVEGVLAHPGPQSLSRHGDVVAAAWRAPSATGAEAVHVATSGDGGITFAAPVALVSPSRVLGTSVVASAHGVDVAWSAATRRPAVAGGFEADVVWARRAGPGDAFAAPVVLGATDDRWTSTPSLAATADAVGVVWRRVADGLGVVATRSGGGGFGPPTPVTGPLGDHAPRLFAPAGAPGPAPDVTATFDWSVPSRFGADTDGDGLVDYHDEFGEVHPDGWELHLDGCRSSGGGHGELEHRWWVDGRLLDERACRVTTVVPDEGVYRIGLEVAAADGTTARADRDVEVQDLLVASVGDSVASGEGNPDVPGGPWPWDPSSRWQDRQCNRSALAGPPQAAIDLEEASVQSSVTFVHLACSGAAVDGPDLATGGLLTPYEGINPDLGDPLDPQLDRLASLALGRELDALFVSIGANDLHFSSVVAGCITSPRCDDPSGPIATDFAQRLEALPGRYARLAARVDELGIAPEKVFVTEYFDPTTDQDGAVNLRCVAGLGGGATLGVTDQEARWAREHVVGPLNAAVRQAAEAHGWTLVDGIAARYTGHGYCSTDSWVVTLGDSFGNQSDKNGAFHPNGTGHQVYAQRLTAAVGSGALPPTSTPPDPADPPVHGPAGDLHLGWVSGGTTGEGGRQAHVTVLRTTGGSVTPVSVVRTSDASSTPGAGPPQVAVGTGWAWAAWGELTHDGGGIDALQVYGAPVAVAPPNLRAASAELVQAPAGAGWLVAGKPTVVRAEVESSAAGSRSVFVGYRIETADGTVVEEGQRMEALGPGRSTIHLHPDDPAGVVEAGEELRAVVVLDPDDLVREADEGDNERSSDAVAAEASRDVRVVVVPIGVTCRQAAAVAQAGAAYVRATLPLAPAQWRQELGCAADLGPTPRTRAQIRTTMSAMEVYAGHAGYDHVIGIVPDGSLASHGAVGLGHLGEQEADGHVFAASLVEVGQAPWVTAHEVAHNLGLGHVEDREAVGYWVDAAQPQVGVDIMDATPGPHWILPEHFELAFDRLRGTTSRAPLLASGSLLVAGTIDGEGGLEAGAWFRSGAPADPEPVGDAPQVVVEQRDADGDLLLTSPVPVAVASHDPDDGGTFRARIPFDDEAAELVVLEDGEERHRRPISASAPTVGGVRLAGDPDVVHAGHPVDVTWDATDPDGDPLEAIVEARTGGGAWRPILVGARTDRVTFTVDRDLADGPLEVRVTVSDGVRTAEATSRAVATDPGAAPPEPRLVVARQTSRDETTLWTASTDGGGLWPFLDPESGRVVEGRRPAWSPDGTRIAFSNATDLRPNPGASHVESMYVAAADGSSLHRLPIDVGRDGTSFSCPSWSPDGSHLAMVSPNGAGRDLVVARDDGSEATVVAAVGPSAHSCPRWSPDGSTLAYRDSTGLHVVPAAGGAPRRVLAFRLPYGEDAVQPWWSSDGEALLFEDPGVAELGDGVWSVSVADGSARQLFGWRGWWEDDAHQVSLRDVRPTADGTRLAFRTTGSYHRSPTIPRQDRLLHQACTVALDGTDRRCVVDLADGLSNELGGYAWADWSAPMEVPPPPPLPEEPRPPAVHAGGPYVGAEGGELRLDGGGTALAAGGAQVAWDLDGDGAFDDATGASPTIPLGGPASDEIAIEVVDPGGDVHRATTTLSVEAVAPSIAPLEPLTATVGRPLALRVPFQDPGPGGHEAWVEVDGDWHEAEVVEAGGAGTAEAALTFNEVGEATVEVEVCDLGGDPCSELEVAVVVSAVGVPTVSAVVPGQVRLGGGEVVVAGDDLYDVVAVTVGGQPADHEPLDGGGLRVVVPPGPAAGPVDVVVTTTSGASGPTVASRVAYVDDLAPVAEDLHLEVPAGTTSHLQLHATDPEGHPVRYELVEGPAHGEVLGVDGATVVYRPDPGHVGADELRYVAHDAFGPGRVATVAIRVGNRAPIASDDAVEGPSDQPLRIEPEQLLADDHDPDGDPVRLLSAWGGGGTHGSVGLTADGAVELVPDPGFVGQTSFTYQVGDGRGGTATALVVATITGAAPDEPPTVVIGPDRIGDEGAAIVIGATVEDDRGPVTSSWSVEPVGDVDPGASCTVAAPAAATTQLSCDDDGVWRAVLTASDGTNPPVSAALTVTVGNVAPVAELVRPEEGEPVEVGTDLEVEADVEDRGTNDAVACLVDAGDGSEVEEVPVDAATGTCAATIRPERAGSQELELVAVDDDGARSAVVRQRIEVQAPPSSTTTSSTSSTTSSTTTTTVPTTTTTAPTTTTTTVPTTTTTTVPSPTTSSTSPAPTSTAAPPTSSTTVPSTTTSAPPAPTTTGAPAVGAGAGSQLPPGPARGTSGSGRGVAGAPLPRTGGDVAPWVGAGALAFVAGAALVALRWRERRRADR